MLRNRENGSIHAQAAHHRLTTINGQLARYGLDCGIGPRSNWIIMQAESNPGNCTDAKADAPFRSGFVRAAVGLAHLSTEGGFRHANAQLCRTLGYELHELEQLRLDDLMHPADQVRHRAQVSRLLAGEIRDAAMECRCGRKDGSRAWVNLGLSLVRGEGATPDFIVAVVEDIHKRKQQESRLRNLRAEMQELLQLNVASQTAKAIAHEINQPLNAISSYAEAALRMLQAGTPDPEKLSRALESTVQQTQRAGRVVRELMEFLQKGETETEPVDLNDAIRNALAVVESNGYGGFEATLDLAQDLRPVRANRLQIEKVLVNLLRNGVEAMRAAGIATKSIRISIRSTDDGTMAQVTVTDNGPGLDPDNAKRIFHPFFTTKPRGIGMGLAISRTLVEAHGGLLWLDVGSAPGATFHFTLPFEE